MSEEKEQRVSPEDFSPPAVDTAGRTRSFVAPIASSDDECQAVCSEQSKVLSASKDFTKTESEFIHDSKLLVLDPSGKLRAGIDLEPLGDEESLLREHGEGRYEMVRALGEGGMGRVYLVVDCDLHRQVAFKVLLAEGNDLRERFIEEAQVLAQLEHPNIVPLHEMGLTGRGRPYCAMRYVRGRSLSELLRLIREGDEEAVRVYSITRLIQVYLQITQALGYAHARGVIHRDLKPSNVMLGEHGEVQVLDWGLAKVVTESGGMAIRQRPLVTTVGQVLGTPSYMSPEQALGQEVDLRSDIYSLGVILYEILTLQRPFSGKTQLELMSSVVSDPPPPPRMAAPHRAIPADLERACMKALAKNPSERHQNARELYEEVESWFEAEADKSKRHALAVAKALAGRANLDEYLQSKTELRRLEVEREQVAKKFDDWQPAEEKEEILDVAQRIADARKQLARAASQAVATLTEALGFHPENELARRTLADYYWDRFVDAETSGDEENRDFFGELVASYHDGKYSKQLKGDGSLSIESEPSGARVTLYRFETRGFRLVESAPQQLGSTPLDSLPLPMGSYVAILRKEGFRDVRYPIFISRNRVVAAKVQLFREKEIGSDFVYVPAGTFIQGGDDRAGGWPLPRSEPNVDEFFIGRFPITMGEYLKFINDLAKQDIDSAVARSPRYAGKSYLIRVEGGFELPEIDSEGDHWFPSTPAFTVTVDDAKAYCEWRSKKDGRSYRLPTETEWEKAARGVDGRIFPWGNHFDGSLCNILTSRRDRPGPVVVEEFPHDVSVYGVRGMAGNVCDFTASELLMGQGETVRRTTVLRGGCWANDREFARCASRNSIDTSVMIGYIAFRIAHSPMRGAD